MINVSAKNYKKTKGEKRLAFLLSPLTLSLCLLFTACENDMNAIMELDKKKAATEEGIDITGMFSQVGKVKAKLTAPAMLRHLETPPFVEFNKGLKVVFFQDTSLQVESTLTAKYGKYYENDANVFLRDSVVVVNKEGRRLDTNELTWDAKKEVFLSDKAVRISTPTDTIYGTGLESNQDFTNYKILKVHGPFTVQDSTMNGPATPPDSNLSPIPATPAVKDTTPVKK